MLGHFKEGTIDCARSRNYTEVVGDLTSLSVCQVARATGEAKCHGSKLHKEVTEIKVYWFVCLNTFKFAKSKNGLSET